MSGIYDVNASTVPADCEALATRVNFLPWNNSDTVVSSDTERLVDTIKSVYVLFAVGAAGVVGNLVNMAVFYRQGLRERINLCLLALAFADFVYMAQNMVLFGERLDPQRTNQRFGPLFTYLVNHNYLGLYGFLWASQFMSAVIASERCFCILFPLKSRTLLTTTTMAIIIVVAFVLIVGGLFVVSVKFYVVCAFDRWTGQSTRILWTSNFYQQHEQHIEWLIFFMYGVVPGLFLAVVLACTIITARELKRVAHWRVQAVSSATSSSVTSSSALSSTSREIALTRMLVATSCLFVVCFLPYLAFRVTCLFVKDLNAGGRYRNMYYLMLSCLDMASFFSSSCNVFVYYCMGSRYRRFFWGLMSQLFGCCCLKFLDSPSHRRICCCSLVRKRHIGVAGIGEAAAKGAAILCVCTKALRFKQSAGLTQNTATA